MAFDPDQYLAEKTGTFDPDKYLAEKAGSAPGRNDAYPEDTTPSDVITTKPAKPVVDFTGNTRRVQEEIRRGAPGEDLTAAEERARQTQEINNPLAHDVLAQELINGAVLGPVAGAVLGGSVARSALREPGAVKQALVRAGESISNHGGHGLAEKVISKVVPGASHAIAAARVARGVGRAGVIAADEGLGAVGRGLGVGAQAARQEASNAVSGRLAAVKDAGEEAAIRRRLAPLKSTTPAADASPVNPMDSVPNDFDALTDPGVVTPTSEAATNVGGKVAPKRPTLAPLEPTALAGELTPKQVELLAKVEERYGKASAEGVKKAIEKQASPKMTAYREKLLAADEAKHAKGLGMSIDQYRAMLAKRAAKL